jgi:hypothetical protein
MFITTLTFKSSQCDANFCVSLVFRTNKIYFPRRIKLMIFVMEVCGFSLWEGKEF